MMKLLGAGMNAFRGVGGQALQTAGGLATNAAGNWLQSTNTAMGATMLRNGMRDTASEQMKTQNTQELINYELAYTKFSLLASQRLLTDLH